MSSIEYYDMYLKDQNESAPYKMYTYDIVASRDIIYEPKDDLLKLIINVMKIIKTIEEQRNVKILYDGSDLIHYDLSKSFEEIKKSKLKCNFGYELEPMMLGDAIGFTIYNNTITDEEVDMIFEEVKKQLEIQYEFHKNNACYSTNDYAKGDKKFFRGYCFDLLTNYIKNKNDFRM